MASIIASVTEPLNVREDNDCSICPDQGKIIEMKNVHKHLLAPHTDSCSNQFKEHMPHYKDEMKVKTKISSYRVNFIAFLKT